MSTTTQCAESHEPSPMLAQGTIRWLPIGRPPEAADGGGADLSPGEPWTGDRFVRCRLDRADTGQWDHGLPPAWDAVPPARAETARNAHTLRELADREVPSAGHPVLVTDVTDEPGADALHGLSLYSGCRTDSTPGIEYRRPGGGGVQIVPVGGIIVSYATGWRTTPDDREVPAGEWRAWRIPPLGKPYLEWQGEDTEIAGGWAPEVETPQEGIARLLDADIHAAFDQWLDRLDADASPVAAAARMSVLQWEAEIRETTRRRPCRRRSSQGRPNRRRRR